MFTKDNITSVAGLVGAVSGAVYISVKDAYPEVAFAAGLIATVCGAIIGFYTGKKEEVIK